MGVLIIVSTTKLLTTNIRQDTSIFLFPLEPLQLTGTTKISKVKTILWENPTPSYTRYCRPIKCMYNKETVKITKN